MDLKNYSLLKIMILEEMLGTQSTLEKSIMLGFKFDKYRRWLKNTKILKWNEFEFICSKLGYDLPDALRMIGYDATDGRDLITYLKEFNNFETNFQLSAYLKAHISVVQRYLSGNTVPDVQTIFKLIGMKPGYLSKFLKKLFKNNIVHIHLNAWIEMDSNTSRLSANVLSPLIEIASNYTLTKTAKPPTADRLAEILNVDVKEVELALTKANGTVKKINHQVNFQESSVKIVLANNTSLRKINEIMHNAQSEIFKILENNSGPATEVGVILMQTFNFTVANESIVKEVYNEAI
jgi:hypothetical protein